eukprot:gene8417-937_t
MSVVRLHGREKYPCNDEQWKMAVHAEKCAQQKWKETHAWMLDANLNDQQSITEAFGHNSASLIDTTFKKNEREESNGVEDTLNANQNIQQERGRRRKCWQSRAPSGKLTTTSPTCNSVRSRYSEEAQVLDSERPQARQGPRPPQSTASQTFQFHQQPQQCNSYYQCCRLTRSSDVIGWASRRTAQPLRESLSRPRMKTYERPLDWTNDRVVSSQSMRQSSPPLGSHHVAVNQRNMTVAEFNEKYGKRHQHGNFLSPPFAAVGLGIAAPVSERQRCLESDIQRSRQIGMHRAQFSPYSPDKPNPKSLQSSCRIASHKFDPLTSIKAIERTTNIYMRQCSNFRPEQI